MLYLELPAVERLYGRIDELAQSSDDVRTPDGQERRQELDEVVSSHPVPQLQQSMAQPQLLVRAQGEHMLSVILAQEGGVEKRDFSYR